MLLARLVHEQVGASRAAAQPEHDAEERNVAGQHRARFKHPRERTAAALLSAALLGVWAPSAADALTIKIDSIAAKPSSDYDPSTRLDLSSTTTTTTGATHVINKADCEAIK